MLKNSDTVVLVSDELPKLGDHEHEELAGGRLVNLLHFVQGRHVQRQVLPRPRQTLHCKPSLVKRIFPLLLNFILAPFLHLDQHVQVVVNCVLAPEELENFEFLGVVGHLQQFARIDDPHDLVLILALNKGSNSFCHKIKIINLVVYLVKSLARR